MSTTQLAANDRRCWENLPRISMDMPQAVEPNFSQNRLPLMRTKRNMKDTEEATLMTPKMPVKKSEDETEVKPADMNIIGA